MCLQIVSETIFKRAQWMYTHVAKDVVRELRKFDEPHYFIHARCILMLELMKLSF